MSNAHLEDHLASYAIKGRDSKGRRSDERKRDRREPFELDRDRILHSKAFRRLEEKTQVFMADTGDHYRSRLTHSLEVAQVARGLSRRLRLNEDLSEAIALAHDLGHPPFGHGGEAALNEVMQKFGSSFEHNEQSKRIVEVLEKSFPHFDGLNLTQETLDGLVKHQTAYDQQGKEFEKAAHLEAQVVNIADEIAYTNHDMDDGIRAGLITLKEMEDFALVKLARQEVKEEYGKIADEAVDRRRLISKMLSLMMKDLVANTEDNLKKNKIKSVEDVVEFQGSLVAFSDDMKKMMSELRGFLYDNFYMSDLVTMGIKRGQMMIKKVFHFYYKNMDLMPEVFERNEMGVKDYVAGMTDLYLTQKYKEI